MGMAFMGLTHCEECGKSLQLSEYIICNECEEQNKKKKENKKMSKTYKGKEIFKMIAEGKIDKNTKVTVDNYAICTLDFVFEDERNLFEWLDEDFELIEDNTIDNIEELDEWVTRRNGEVTQTEGKILEIGNKVNELVQAVKQLNKEIKELKEKQ